LYYRKALTNVIILTAALMSRSTIATSATKISASASQRGHNKYVFCFNTLHHWQYSSRQPKLIGLLLRTSRLDVGPFSVGDHQIKRHITSSIHGYGGVTFLLNCTRRDTLVASINNRLTVFCHFAPPHY